MAGDETILGKGRFGTDRDGYAAMKTYAKQWSKRVWAIEGCQGIGPHIANRLLADGERVLEVPPKLSARTPGLRHRAWPQDRRHRRPFRSYAES
jgi:transposase